MKPIEFSVIRLCSKSIALIAITLLVAIPGSAAIVIWSGADTNSGNFTWADAANWTGGAPSGNDVKFYDPGTAPTVSNINNVVSANLTITSLKIGNTNFFHTTLINPGVTLTVSNSTASNMIFVGTGTDDGVGGVVNTVVTGPGGQLAVISTNVASLMIVQEGSSAGGAHTAILDLSGLDTFNATMGRLLVAGAPGTAINASNFLSATLYLAKTNTVRLNGTATPVLDVGDAVSNGGTTFAYLGQTNAIFADTFTIARLKATSTMAFNPQFIGNNPVLFLNGNSGSRVVTLSVGDFSGQTSGSSSITTGTMDLSGGIVNALVNTCYVGRGQAANGSGTCIGTLNIGAGTFNVNTLYAGYISAVAATARATGTINLTNGTGTLIINTNLVLGLIPIGSTAPATATLNISNATVYANNISSTNVNVTSTINMTGGTLVVTNTAGAPGFPIGTVNLAGATLKVPGGQSAASMIVGFLNFEDNNSVISVSAVPVLFGYPTAVPLINYSSLVGGSTINLGTLPGTYQGYISNDLASTVWVVITNGPSTLKADLWGGGVNNLWDTNTLNWTNAGAAVRYIENDSVAFDDRGKTGVVNVVTTHVPLGFSFTNSILNYTLTGAGNISGVVGLTKQGTGTLTLAETGGDNFSGGIAVGAGTVILDDPNCAISGGIGITNGATLQIGNNDANGVLPAGAVDDEGTLAISRSDNVLLSTGFGGGGGLTQTGNGTLTLNATMAYTGNTIIGRGALLLTNSASLSNSASLLISNSTFDVSALVGQTTVLNILNVTNATFNVALNGLQPPISVLNYLQADGIVGVSNKINVTSLPILASYPVTFPIIQCSGITLTGGNFNFAVGSLPAGYSGTMSEIGGNTVALTLTSGPVGQRPSVIWSGADALNLNTNWSDGLNWQLPGVPTPTDNVIFNNLDAMAGSVLAAPGGGLSSLVYPQNFDNFVDLNFTISTLSFTNNSGSFHNTAIADGATLTITNTFTVGAQNLSPVQQGLVTIAGESGTLKVSTPNAPLQVWNGNGTTAGSSGSQATLDLSALASFNATVSELAVGACVGGATNYPSGILYLAQTNNITATYQTSTEDTAGTTANAGIVMADCIFNAGLQSFLYLGEVNTITSDSVAIGRQKASATMQFNSIYQNAAPYPSVTFQGYSSSTVGLFEVGGGAFNTGTTTLTADANLTGGTVHAQINTLNIGIASTATSGAGTTTGKLEFDAGNISAGTAYVGYQPVASANKVGVGSLTIGANGNIGTNATLSVSGTLNLAVNVNSASTAGSVDISGGVLAANAIVAGVNGAASTITLENNGTLVVTNFAGTTAAPLTTLNLGGGTLQLDINGSSLVTNIVATTINAGGPITLNIGAIVNGLGLTTVPLISYTGVDPFSVLTLNPLPAGFTGILVDNTANNRIDLSIIAAPGALTWVGAVGSTLNGNWDFSTMNWQNGSPAAYADPEFTTFDDTASNNLVTLTTTVSPGEVNVSNNVLNYTFSGGGHLSGLAGISKSGSGSLTLTENGGDNFTGGIVVNPNGGSVILDNANSAPAGGTVIGSAATVQVGNHDTHGVLPGGSVANNGTLILNHTDSLAVPNTISGGGNVIQSGSGVAILSSVNTYGGGTLVSGGTLQLVVSGTAPNVAAAGTGTITNNGVLAITNNGAGPAYINETNTVSGSGSIFLPQNQEVNFDGPGNLAAFTGTLNIPGGTVLAAKGDITSTNVSLNAGAVINLASGGTLWVANAGVLVPATINLAGYGNGEGWGALRVDTAAIYSGPVHLQGNGSIGAQNGAAGTISGAISDGGNNYSLTKLGAVTSILIGANTYGGGTVVSNATLQIGNSFVNGTLPGNTLVAVSNTILSFVVATNTSQTYSGVISGPGSVLENGFGGTLLLNGLNTFTNGLAVNAGALWITNAAALGSGPKNITVNNGTAGHCELHLNGVSGNILLPSTLSFLTSWIGGGGSAGDIINETGNNEIDGAFSLTTGGGGTAFVINGGTLKLAGNITPAATQRTLQFGGVGNGTVSGVIADSGTNILTGVSVVGPGAWTIVSANNYATVTTVAGGTLLVNGSLGAGGVNVQSGGTLGGSGSLGGASTVLSGGIIQGGDAGFANTLTAAALNLGDSTNAVTYSRFTVSTGGKIAATTLKVNGTNIVQILDPSLTVGTNTLFTYTGALGGTNGFAGFQLGALPTGVTAALLNTGSAIKLAVTSIVTVNTNSPVLTNSISGGTLTLSWPADHLGWRLQVQTNTLSAGLGNNWVTWPNSTNVTSIPIPISQSGPSVFFRLTYP